MGEREAFEAAIRDDPYDGVTRKVFADWLDEHDEPEAADWQRSWTPEWQRASDWVGDFCRRVGLNRRYFMAEAARHLDDGDDIEVTLNTSNATMDEDMAEVWRNVGVVLRREVDAGKGDGPFTCGSDCFPDGLDWEDGED